MRIGESLKERRKRGGLTLVELATAAGVSVSHLSGIERGVALPSLVVCQKLADHYGTSLSFLLAGVSIELKEEEPDDGVPEE